MNSNIISRIGVLAAVKTARELYPTEEEAMHQVATQLCMTPEEVAAAIEPLSMDAELRS
jgi:hypothetical protein